MNIKYFMCNRRFRKRQYDEININELSLRHSKYASSSMAEAQDPFVLLPPCVLEEGERRFHQDENFQKFYLAKG